MMWSNNSDFLAHISRCFTPGVAGCCFASCNRFNGVFYSGLDLRTLSNMFFFKAVLHVLVVGFTES